MVFQSLTADEVLPGEPTKSELFDKLRLDVDDLNDRMTVLEGTANSFPPIVFDVMGTVDTHIIANGLIKYRAHRNLTLLAVRLQVDLAGSAGTLTVDLKRKSAGVYSSVLSSPLTAVYTDGNDYVDSATIAIPDILLGEILRIDVSSIQTGMKDFHVYAEYEGA